MTARRERTSRACVAIFLVVGVGFVFIGLLVVPVLPDFQLDAVLTREELADERTREATLVLLKRASGNTWLFWSIAGLIITAVSAISLWTTFGVGESPGDPAEEQG